MLINTKTDKIYTNADVIQMFADEVGTDLVEAQQFLERCQYSYSSALALYIYGIVPNGQVPENKDRSI